jgi:hypothetical protein
MQEKIKSEKGNLFFLLLLPPATAVKNPKPYYKLRRPLCPSDQSSLPLLSLHGAAPWSERASPQRARKKKDRKHTEENAMVIHAKTKMLYINSSNQGKTGRRLNLSFFLVFFFRVSRS